jgi:rhodanese-related sulfurtransferase
MVGAAVAAAAVSTELPAFAAQQPVAAAPEQFAAAPQRAAPFAYLADADAPPVIADLQEADPLETLKLGVAALFIPIIGYASWRFGSYKAKVDASEAAEKYAKELEEGKFDKVSPSGIATVKGFAASSEAGWKMQADTLRARGIEGISGEELAKMAKSDDICIVDVRDRTKYKEAFIPGSVNVPLFQPIQGWDLYKIARRVQFAVFGVQGTEYNPNFTEEFNRLVGPQKDKKLVVLDDSVRGTLVPTQAFPEGKAGHALMTIYLALNGGFENTPMTYVEGGIGAYAKADGELAEA